MTLQFNKAYAIIFIAILAIEILIATFLTHGFIRYTFGYYLVVILLYCFIKGFLKVSSIKIAIGVLLFAYGIVFLQLINLLDMLDLNNNHLAKPILGSTFNISDLVAYTLGIMTVLIMEIRYF
uniref:ribosomal maturation YjgA family protein n=1 Tax=Mariniflexile sp. TaxID=1979402 RepID=UPI00404883A7